MEKKINKIIWFKYEKSTVTEQFQINTEVLWSETIMSYFTKSKINIYITR